MAPMAGVMRMEAKMPPTQIESGNLEINASVTVGLEVK
jgi:hypothetical protein